MRALFVILAVVAMAAIPAAAQQKSAASKPAPAAKAAGKPAVPTSPVNINTATQEQLEALPGLGAKVAQRIIEYRQKNGNFKKVEDLMNVKGIGEKSFLKLKPMLTISQKAEPIGAPER
jgi:competence protein ComEA